MTLARVAIVHNIFTPYRAVLFDAIDAHIDIDLHVYYCARSHENRNWTIPANTGHDYTVLPGLRIDRGGFRYHINPTIVAELLRGRYDVTIVGGATNFTMQLAYVVSQLGLDGTILWTERIRQPQGKFGKLAWPLLGRLARHADSLIVPTARARRFQSQRNIPNDRIHVAPNVVDNDAYWANKKQSEKATLLFIGQLIDRKGIPYLLDALESLERDDVETVLVGDGPKRAEYERRVLEEGLEVTFTGWISEDEKRQRLSNADCFVLPSVEDLAPLVVNEAMAAGLPVLTTDGVGNAADMIIEDCNGWVVPAKNGSALAEELRRVIENKDELRKMGERSRRIVAERFSPEFAANRFSEAIESALQ